MPFPAPAKVAHLFPRLGLFADPSREAVAASSSQEGEIAAGAASGSDSGVSTGRVLPPEVKAFVDAFGWAGYRAMLCLKQLDPNDPEKLLNEIKRRALNPIEELKLVAFILNHLKKHFPKMAHQIEALEKFLAHKKSPVSQPQPWAAPAPRPFA